MNNKTLKIKYLYSFLDNLKTNLRDRYFYDFEA